MIEEKNDIIFAVTDTESNRVLTLKFPVDINIGEIIQEFKVILKWLTFNDKLIEEHLPSEE